MLQSCLYADPMELQAMYYNRSQNPAKPKWMTVRGSSTLEAYHPHLHACLPGTNYSPYLADAIITLMLSLPMLSLPCSISPGTTSAV